MGECLNVLETFAEGEFVLAQKLKFVRKYVVDTKDSTNYSHYTQISNIAIGSEHRGQIGMFHGFA